MQLQSTTLSLGFLLTCAPLVAGGGAGQGDQAPQAGTTGSADVLFGVPEGAIYMAYAEDIAGVRQRAEKNAWTQGLAGEPAPMIGVLAAIGGSRRHPSLDSALELASLLSGPGVFFESLEGTAFLLSPRTGRDDVRRACLNWLGSESASGERLEGQWGGAVITIYDRDLGPVWNVDEGRQLAAFVDHPSGFGLYAAPDRQRLVALIGKSLRGLEAGSEAQCVTRFREARAKVGPMGVELFKDYEPLAAEAKLALQDAAELFFTNPESLLGLEPGAWLYATADFESGSRLEMRAHLEIPRGGLMERLAGTFSALPHDLLVSVPKDTWSLGALKWNFMAFYGIARQALKEHGQEDKLAVADSVLAAGDQATGVDLEKRLLGQLDGLFSIYLCDPKLHASGHEQPIENWVLEMGIEGSDVFREALEQVLDCDLLAGTEYDVLEIEGQDVFVFPEEDALDLGFTFLPKRFLVAFHSELLRACLKAMNGVPGAGVLDGTRMEGAFDENSGACAFACLELSAVRDFVESELETSSAGPAQAGLALEESQAGASASDHPDPFSEQIAVAIRRTPTGFDLRAYTR